MEEENKLFFFDWTVNKHFGKHSFSLFYKLILLFKILSCIRIKIKWQSTSMIHRLVSIEQSEQNLNLKLNIRKHIALNNEKKTMEMVTNLS